jgi:AcrR family transcriptional regulator
LSASLRRTEENTVERLTAGDYFREALTILGNWGSESLTIALLCEHLQVTKGSFYHHFGGMPNFVTQLLAFWESEHSERLIAVSRAQRDPAARIPLLIELAVGLPHASEAAIRAWSRSNPEVAEVSARVDRRRERHLVDAMAAVGVDRAQARLLGRLAMDVLIGAQQREYPVDLKRLRALFEQVTRLIVLDADRRLVAPLTAAR